MRPRGAGSHTVRISPILILIFFCQRSVERGEAPTPEREGNKGGGEEREERRERGEKPPSPEYNRTGRARPGHATPNTHTHHREERERGKRERGKRERGKRHNQQSPQNATNPQHENEDGD